MLCADNRTSQLLGVLEDITDHYQDTLDTLRVHTLPFIPDMVLSHTHTHCQVINDTLVGMQVVVEGMSSAVHSQLDWVVSQLGGANRGLRYTHTFIQTSER